MEEFKARYRTDSNKEYQLLETHLAETAMFVELFAKKIGLQKPALLIGSSHDIGKGNPPWQDYLEQNKVFGRAEDKKDHATAGGQFLYREISQNKAEGAVMVAEVLAACAMYHHGPGLPDVVKPDGTTPLQDRLNKDEELEESLSNFKETTLWKRVEGVLSDESLVPETVQRIVELMSNVRDDKANGLFNLGLTARFLSSCLIDADRTSSANYDRGIPADAESAMVKPDWEGLLRRLEDHVKRFPMDGNINEIRRDVSNRCADFGKRESGIYTLTAATGAGKTLAALRYALVHAQEYHKDRIFIIAPYTSILDQTAAVIRDILDLKGKNGDVILEHHSNLDQNEMSGAYIDCSQTWNVPIVITTMVQFLEALFAHGTRKIRRMHQLANAVVVLDEVQTLPVSCTFLFTWALNFLSEKCNTSFLLCTATQPGLDQIRPEKYALRLSEENEIIPDLARHFEILKRVDLIDKTGDGFWSLEKTAAFIEEQQERHILTVVNTKPQAQKLYTRLSAAHPDWQLVHLSTNMCPAHREKVIKQLTFDLKDKSKKIICISTRLIEAGVDIDFDCAIRFLAGLDSVIQTAGRCNRNGELRDAKGNLISGKVYLVRILRSEEYLGSMEELRLGQDVTEHILRIFHEDEAVYENTLLHPDLISLYFQHYYANTRDGKMKYHVSPRIAGRDASMIDLLSTNDESLAEYKRTHEAENWKITVFHQSFETAWQGFEVIADDTVGVLVPFEEGEDIINRLFAGPDPKTMDELLRSGQRYSVNIYSNTIRELEDSGIIKRVNNKTLIYTVNPGYYDNDKIGLTGKMGKLTSQVV
jgi:CRISPR-associated endonuclease/helicase Cas3